MRFDDVLFPTDFSAVSDAPARVAREIALASGARLHLLYVVPPVTDPGDALARLASLAASLGEGLQVETAVLSGRVARHIVEYARDKRVGLIVLGTHGRTGVSHAILGSVAEAVVRLAPCLVLVVPPSALAPATAARPELPASQPCIVCGGAGADFVCETCRARIRAEAIEHTQAQPGRRDSPV